MKRFRGIADNRQTTASRRTVLGEGCNENVAAGPHRALNLLDISSAVRGIGEKMKDGAIVPDRIRALAEWSISNVRGNPAHSDCINPESIARDIECGLRDIEYGQIHVAGGEKIVDQNRDARSDIDDRGGSIGSESCYELDRLACLLLEPAQCLDVFRPIDSFPMSLRIHSSFRQIFIGKICHSPTGWQGRPTPPATFSDPVT